MGAPLLLRVDLLNRKALLKRKNMLNRTNLRVGFSSHPGELDALFDPIAQDLVLLKWVHSSHYSSWTDQGLALWRVSASIDPGVTDIEIVSRWHRSEYWAIWMAEGLRQWRQCYGDQVSRTRLVSV